MGGKWGRGLANGEAKWNWYDQEGYPLFLCKSGRERT